MADVDGIGEGDGVEHEGDFDDHDDADDAIVQVRPLAQCEDQENVRSALGVSKDILMKGVALAHYQLRGPLRYNFAKSYVQASFDWDDKNNYKYGLHIRCRLLLAVPIAALLPLLSTIFRPASFCHDADVFITEHNKSHAALIRVDHTKCDVENFLLSWEALAIGPVLLILALTMTQAVTNGCGEWGQRLMLVFFRMLLMVVPGTKPLKYWNTPTIYGIVTHAYFIFLLEMSIVAVHLRAPSAMVVGYVFGSIFVQAVAAFLGPSDEVIALTDAAIRSAGDGIFARLPEHANPCIAFTAAEARKLRKAALKTGELKGLFDDAEKSQLSFWVGTEAIKRKVYWSNLYLQNIYIPENTDGTVRVRVETPKGLGVSDSEGETLNSPNRSRSRFSTGGYEKLASTSDLDELSSPLGVSQK